jgi:hypothetical protein
VRRIPVARLVFLDESGVHLAMSRSHTWVKRGREYIDPVPVNWGTTLTLLGAIRLHGWVVLRSIWATANAERFLAWLTHQLLPQLHRGDVLVMDNPIRPGPTTRRTPRALQGHRTPVSPQDCPRRQSGTTQVIGGVKRNA